MRDGRFAWPRYGDQRVHISAFLIGNSVPIRVLFTLSDGFKAGAQIPDVEGGAKATRNGVPRSMGLGPRRFQYTALRSEKLAAYTLSESFHQAPLAHIHHDLQSVHLSSALAPRRLGGLVCETCSVDDRRVLPGRNHWRFVANALNRGC